MTTYRGSQTGRSFDFRFENKINFEKENRNIKEFCRTYIRENYKESDNYIIENTWDGEDSMEYTVNSVLAERKIGDIGQMTVSKLIEKLQRLIPDKVVMIVVKGCYCDITHITLEDEVEGESAYVLEHYE